MASESFANYSLISFKFASCYHFSVVLPSFLRDPQRLIDQRWKDCIVGLKDKLDRAGKESVFFYQCIQWQAVGAFISTVYTMKIGRSLAINNKVLA